MVTEIKGRKQQAEQTLAKIDEDLKQNGAKREDVKYVATNTVRCIPSSRSGQLKIDQISNHAER